MKVTGGRRGHYLHAKSTAELLQPEILPEAGFQSYEELKNNGLQLTYSFIRGIENNPDLHHPNLEETNRLEQGITNLNDAIKTVNQLESDNKKADIIATSLRFRADEMEYVKKLAELDDAIDNNLGESHVSDLLESTRELGHTLYGDIDPNVLEGVYNTIWNDIDSKDFHPSAIPIYNQLTNGFNWDGTFVRGLERPNTKTTLPDFNDPSLDWTGETILAAHPDEVKIVKDFWREKTILFGHKYSANTENMADAFKRVLKQFDDPENPVIDVVVDPNSNSLSWETSMMAIKVGANRAPITSEDQLLKKVAHELLVHGGRAINGLKSDLPVLGTGLYTETDRPDYLTFEEGLATTLEESIGTDQPSWNASMLAPYVNVALVNNGADFRSAFETSWRWRLLMSLKSGEAVTTEAVLREKVATYNAALRVFRGTPTAMQDKYPGAKVLTYNKDLSYLNGRVIVMNYLKDLHENNDSESLLNLLSAKFDPTVPEQAEIVRQYAAA